MKINYILSLLIILNACVTTFPIKDSDDFKKADKSKPFIYLKLDIKTFSNDEYLSVENLISMMRVVDGKVNTCAVFLRAEPGKFEVGRYHFRTGGVTVKPKRLQEWEFDIPKEGFYYLGTLTQGSSATLVFEDGNKDECDKYIKSINPDFDPKTAVVLRPQRKRYAK